MTDSAQPEDDVLTCFCTSPDAENAAVIARHLVTEGLAACVNLLPGVRSIYKWEGKVTEDAEVMLVIKTTRARLATLAQRLSALHPYELPELIAVPVCAGSQPYLAWVRQNTAPSR